MGLISCILSLALLVLQAKASCICLAGKVKCSDAISENDFHSLSCRKFISVIHFEKSTILLSCGTDLKDFFPSLLRVSFENPEICNCLIDLPECRRDLPFVPATMSSTVPAISEIRIPISQVPILEDARDREIGLLEIQNGNLIKEIQRLQSHYDSCNRLRADEKEGMTFLKRENERFALQNSNLEKLYAEAKRRSDQVIYRSEERRNLSADATLADRRVEWTSRNYTRIQKSSPSVLLQFPERKNSSETFVLHEANSTSKAILLRVMKNAELGMVKEHPAPSSPPSLSSAPNATGNFRWVTKTYVLKVFENGTVDYESCLECNISNP